MQLTKERAVTLHRRMWRWIGLKTLKEKRCVEKNEWFKRFKLNSIACECYCCEYAYQLTPHPNWNAAKCDYCPIDWGNTPCHDTKALYTLWGHKRGMKNWQEAGKLALQIAELPEMERRFKMVNKVNIKLDGNECVTINDDCKISVDANGNLVVHNAGKRDIRVVEEPSKRHTGIEEPEEDDDVYYIDGDDCSDKFTYSLAFKGDYLRGRIATDEQLCSDRDRAAQIRFALEKYAAEHNAGPIDWTDYNNYKYYIFYDAGGALSVGYLNSVKTDNIYFDSRQTAVDAIKAVGEEDVLWLYRDYQPYLNAFKMD